MLIFPLSCTKTERLSLNLDFIAAQGSHYFYLLVLTIFLCTMINRIEVYAIFYRIQHTKFLGLNSYGMKLGILTKVITLEQFAPF